MIPKYGNKKFKCPHCMTVASQSWFTSNKASQCGFTANNASDVVTGILNSLYLDYRSKINEHGQKYINEFLKNTDYNFRKKFNDFFPDGFSIATCSSCDEFTLWVNKEIIYPKKTTIPLPNIDLNDEIKGLYLEASSILIDSPKGSTAILRLALQELLKQIGKSGKNINSDIKELVADGLSSETQQALDVLRVIGNNAVHPGQIDWDDNTKIAKKLFGILNFIAEELITKPKEREEFYADLIPTETQEHIKQRDGT